METQTFSVGKREIGGKTEGSHEAVAPEVYFVIFIDSFIKKPSSHSRAVSEVCLAKK